MKKVLLAYIPVLHEGYRELFVRDLFATDLYLFGTDLIGRFDPLAKDIRALPPYLVKQAIESWEIFKEVFVADESTLQLLNQEQAFVVMPDEDVCHEAAKQYLYKCRTEFCRVFLRWDSRRALAESAVPCDQVIQADEFIARIMKFALKEAKNSPDWWRQIGAVAVKGGEVLIVAFNRHVPSANHVWAFGDPRSNFKKGVHFELSPALHAEAAIVAEAARKGLSLEGTDLYVTCFPCPPCARVLAYSGIKNLFFLEGYAVYDGVDVLRAKGVEIIRVRM